MQPARVERHLIKSSSWLVPDSRWRAGELQGLVLSTDLDEYTGELVSDFQWCNWSTYLPPRVLLNQSEFLNKFSLSSH
jgi:hypothetical protein